MSYLLDTNVLSEVVKRKPDARVIGWLREIPDNALHLSVLSVGEVRSGIEGLHHSPRKERLRVWLEQDLPGWFEDRLLPVDTAVADRWGRLVAAVSRPLPAIDSLLAATAQTHGLRLATRNTKDFAGIAGLDLVNPWKA